MQGITDIITIPGMINVDFVDVRSVMFDAGSALMGIGKARGENRALIAAEQAINSPLLESTMEGARGVPALLRPVVSDLGLHEVNAAADMVEQRADEDVNLIFGAIIDDDNLGDEVRSNRRSPPALTTSSRTLTATSAVPRCPLFPHRSRSQHPRRLPFLSLRVAAVCFEQQQRPPSDDEPRYRELATASHPRYVYGTSSEATLRR